MTDKELAAKAREVHEKLMEYIDELSRRGYSTSEFQQGFCGPVKMRIFKRVAQEIDI